MYVTILLYLTSLSMITLDNITKKFNNFTALDNLSFSIEKEGVYGLLGPNGAGKTTALRLLAQYFPPTDGTMTIQGLSMWDSDLIKKKIGYLPESNPLYHDLKVIEFLELLSDLHGLSSSQAIERITAVIKICGLDEKKHVLIDTLSKGYKQRCGLAGALISDPDILILDEPTEGLDPNQRVEIRNLIKEIGRSKIVIVSSHVLQEIDALCDYVYIINKGKLVTHGQPAALKKDLQQAPLIELKVVGPELQIKQALLAVPGVKNVIAGNTSEGVLQLSLELEENSNPKKAIVKTLVDNEWELQAISSKEASLEEVFTSLTQH